MSHHRVIQPWEWYVAGTCIVLMLLYTYMLFFSGRPKRRRLR